MFHTPFHKVDPSLPQAGQIVDDPRVGIVVEPEADIFVRNHGTLFGFTANTQSGKEWLAANLSHAQTLGDAYYVEHRCAWDITAGMIDDGLKVA